jgi:beta-galactosidase
MFDFGSSRYRTGLRNTGLMTHDHAQCKDAYYLYKTLWHDRRPTLHIVGKSAPIRSRNRQAVRIYSSQGAPTVLVNGDTVAVRQRSIGVFVTDSLTLSGRNHIEAHTADCRDSMTLVIGNYLRRH